MHTLKKLTSGSYRVVFVLSNGSCTVIEKDLEKDVAMVLVNFLNGGNGGDTMPILRRIRHVNND